jgi:hypothetical protein
MSKMWKQIWKESAIAEYTDTDPLDMGAVIKMIEDLNSHWWLESPQDQRQAIANAMRAALVSPNMDLKWNAIVYQDLMHIPADVDDPEVFEQAVRAAKAKWDHGAQMTLDSVPEKHAPWAPHMVEKYRPGMWTNVRRAAGVAPYVEQIRQAALADLEQGGDGRVFREQLRTMGIPGVGDKIISFAWLLLNPSGSRIATIDRHILRNQGEDYQEGPQGKRYTDLEQQLDAQRIADGYEDVPLGAYQWALWDKQRTPGYHQDHSALRPINPTKWHDVDWEPRALPPRPKDKNFKPNDQMNLIQWSENDPNNPWSLGF